MKIILKETNKPIYIGSLISVSEFIDAFEPIDADGNTVDGFVKLTSADVEVKYETEDELKQVRDARVNSIIVTLTSGVRIDGNEPSQSRLSRAVLGLSDSETISWIDADNNPVELTKADCAEALRLSGEAQTAIYVEYMTQRVSM